MIYTLKQNNETGVCSSWDPGNPGDPEDFLTLGTGVGISPGDPEDFWTFLTEEILRSLQEKMGTGVGVDGSFGPLKGLIGNSLGFSEVAFQK